MRRASFALLAKRSLDHFTRERVHPAQPRTQGSARRPPESVKRLRSCREEFEILCRRPLDCPKRDRGVEGGQSALIRYRKSEKVDVGKLAVALNAVPMEPTGIAHADRVRPENVLTIRTEGRGAPARIGRIGQYTDERVLRERTRRPSLEAVASALGVSPLVMHVSRIEQRDQNVYVKKSTRFWGSSRSRLTISGVTNRAPFWSGSSGTPLRLRGERS